MCVSLRQVSSELQFSCAELETDALRCKWLQCISAKKLLLAFLWLISPEYQCDIAAIKKKILIHSQESETCK